MFGSATAIKDGAGTAMGFGFKQAGTIDNDELYSNRKLAGIKYNEFGARSGLGSLMDGELIRQNIAKETRNMGSGAVQLVSIGPDGKPSLAPMCLGGRMHFPNADGTFRIVDEDKIRRAVELENERREYIEKIISDASASDETCCIMLSCDMKELDTHLGPGGDGWYNGGATLHKDIIDVDARPSSLETYSVQSKMYSDAIRKFKIACKARMPIMENFTPAKVENLTI